MYNDTDEIRRQIDFMKECQKSKKNFSYLLEMQVAVVAAGGEVKSSKDVILDC